jgi:hypothetical protein
MKKIIKLSLVAILVAVSSIAASARGNHRGGCDQRPPQPREELAQGMAERIAKRLKLDEATSKKFVETYCESQKEMWAMRPQPARPEGEQADKDKKGGCPQKPTQLTDDQAKEIISEQFKRGQEILDLRKKYYNEYSKFMTPSQILRFYDMERDMNEQFANGRKAPGKAPQGAKGQKGGPMGPPPMGPEHD